MLTVHFLLLYSFRWAFGVVLWELVTLGKAVIAQLIKHVKFNIMIVAFFLSSKASCNSASMKLENDSM